MKQRIYLDNNATTAIDPRVLEAMMPFLTSEFGNSASRNHDFGWVAEKAVKQARVQVAQSIGAKAKDVLFTAGATESNNIALIGAARAYSNSGRHLISTNIEHKSVLKTFAHLETEGFRVTYLKADCHGQIAPDALSKAMTDETTLVSVMWANNEVGTINPIRRLAEISHARGALFHTDIAQALGKVPIDVVADGVDLASASAHKLYGPKGIGLLYCRRSGPRVRLAPIFHGGGQELGLRPGTLNVPGIVGFGKTCEVAVASLSTEPERLTRLRARLFERLSELGDVYLNGHPTARLAGNLNVSIAYVEGDALMVGLPSIAVSSGSACNSAKLEPSYVLRAMGVSDALIHTSIRFGLGRFTTADQIDYVAERVCAEVRRLRAISPLYEMASQGTDLAKVNWRPVGELR